MEDACENCGKPPGCRCVNWHGKSASSLLISTTGKRAGTCRVQMSCSQSPKRSALVSKCCWGKTNHAGQSSLAAKSARCLKRSRNYLDASNKKSSKSSKHSSTSTPKQPELFCARLRETI